MAMHIAEFVAISLELGRTTTSVLPNLHVELKSAVGLLGHL